MRLYLFTTFLLLSCILSIPLSNAETVEGSFQTYNIATHAGSVDNPPTAALFTHNIDPTPIHQFSIDTSYAILSIEYTARFPDSAAGIWRYDVLWDDEAIPNCFWNIETVSILTVSVAHYPIHSIVCLLDENLLSNGDHEFIITRFALSGSPSTITHETISYQLDRTDLLEPDMTNEMLVTFNTFAPLFVLFLIIVWAEWTKNFLIYMVAIVLDIIAVAALSTELSGTLLIILVATAAILALRSYQTIVETGENAV